MRVGKAKRAHHYLLLAEDGGHGASAPLPTLRYVRDQAALTLRCLNMLARASSSISALNLNLSFSAIALAAAGRAEISSTSRLTLGYFAKASSPMMKGIMRAQPQTSMSTMV